MFGYLWYQKEFHELVKNKTEEFTKSNYNDIKDPYKEAREAEMTLKKFDDLKFKDPDTYKELWGHIESQLNHKLYKQKYFNYEEDDKEISETTSEVLEITWDRESDKTNPENDA